MAEQDGLQLDLAVGADGGHARAFGAEQHHVLRHQQRVGAAADRQFDLHVGAGQQRVVVVGQVDFQLQRAGGGVDGAGGARHRALELLAGQFGLRDGDAVAGLDALGVSLRHVDVDAQRVDLGQAEQRAAGAAVAGVDQVAHVDGAAGDDAGEGRDDALEFLGLLQAAHVGVGGGQVGHAPACRRWCAR